MSFQIRDTIFIGHATPEDNDFTIWLASRLQLLGYKVWIDKNALVGGEKFWEEIDQVIRNTAAKYLLVYSKNICYQNVIGKLKDGIYKEFSLAESISKQYNISDFLILLNVDNAPHNLFIGSDRLNQIVFFENWAEGFKQLHKKLIKDDVSIAQIYPDSEFLTWFQYQYITPKPIINKKEQYYSNIWPIPKLPENFYIHQFKKADQAKFIFDNNKLYPLGKLSNHIISFEADLLYNTEDIENGLVADKIFAVRISDILTGTNSSTFPNLIDKTNYFKILLNRVFHILMKNRKMFWYEMSSKRLAYFYTPANLTSGKVKFQYPGRRESKKLKNLFGIYNKVFKWHYAVSVKTVISPVLGYSLKNHLTFTSDGFRVWVNDKNEIETDKIHSHRRKKGKMFFNEEWRDMFLAFLHGLKQENGQISIQLSADYTLIMPTSPEIYWSTFGYFDPKDKSRQSILSYYEDEDDNDDEIKGDESDD